MFLALPQAHLSLCLSRIRRGLCQSESEGTISDSADDIRRPHILHLVCKLLFQNEGQCDIYYTQLYPTLSASLGGHITLTSMEWWQSRERRCPNKKFPLPSREHTKPLLVHINHDQTEDCGTGDWKLELIFKKILQNGWPRKPALPENWGWI